MFQVGLDPTQDMPVEILHTVLLGIMKYIWHMLHTSMTEEQRNLFVVRLQSTDLDGLTVPPLRAAYIMQYRNNLIGKHFKTLMQTIAFHVHDFVTPAQFDLIKSAGELGAFLWVHEIEDMELYLVRHVKIIYYFVIKTYFFSRTILTLSSVILSMHFQQWIQQKSSTKSNFIYFHISQMIFGALAQLSAVQLKDSNVSMPFSACAQSTVMAKPQVETLPRNSLEWIASNTH